MLQTAINWFQVVALAVVVALAGGLAASVMLEAWHPKGVERTVAIEPVATPARVTPSPEVEAPAPGASDAPAENTPSRLRPVPWLGESPNLALRWVGSVVLLLLLGMVLGLALLRSRSEVEKDSDVFAETSREVAPVVHGAKPTRGRSSSSRTGCATWPRVWTPTITLIGPMQLTGCFDAGCALSSSSGALRL